jgi:hypothetical protein
VVAERRRGAGNLGEVLSAILRTTSSSALSPREITVKLRIGNHDADIEEILAILPGGDLTG